MDNIIFQLRTPIYCIGMLTGYSEPALLYGIETGNKIPVEVAGITAKYKAEEIVITLLSPEDLKELSKK